MTELGEKIKEIFSSGKGMKIAVAVGMIGIILIFISDLIPEKSEEKCNISETGAQYFIEAASEEMKKVVSSITGEANPTVYITADSGISSVYATEIRSDDSEREEKVIIIKNSAGDQTGLLVRQIQPEVKGVVVVSSGAGDPVLKEKIISAVMTAFDIPSSKVCVVSKYK